MKITQAVIRAVIEHARKALPHEACGYLAARDGVVSRHYELTNLDRAVDHFSMDPAEQFAAINDMRQHGLRLAAAYHSHPETPPRPSEEDIRLAYDPEISYVIASLAEPAGRVESFKIRKGEVTPEPIEIVEDEMETTRAVDAIKNCRGVGCPMNLVYTKVELARLQSGQVLEVILDDGPPVNNVPGSIAREGHRVLSLNRLADGSWSMLLEKG